MKTILAADIGGTNSRFAWFQDNFRNEFTDSPTMGHILSAMPVFLMDDQNSGLWGAAFYGQQLLRKG